MAADLARFARAGGHLSSRPADAKAIRRARLRLLGVGVLVAFVVWTVATVGLFIRPATSLPPRADAVVVLSGDHGERLSKARSLLRAGVSDRLVLAGEPDMVEVLELCRGGQPFEVICLRPNPDNTRNEARAASELGRQRGWKRIVVVTSTQHVARSRLVFERCATGHVHMVAARRPLGAVELSKQVLTEWTKYAYTAVVARGC